MKIRKATLKDLDAVYKLANKNAGYIGYIPKPTYKEGIIKNEIIVVEENGKIVGLCNFHKTKKGYTTIYEIVVEKEYRRKGYRKTMIQYLRDNKHLLRLKCPTEQEANKFYEKIGFKKVATVKGKKRPLNIWRDY